ncbi:Sporulation related domain-containing protein [Flexibacter flexilis DSM 6793]|uniref:Sporulation related domain-containing protein n=1 Tax=Flexibacter flexilis DSM 6793 TaxID=927664 RepID=A0A1I1JV99_9BACT|nr:SPOR domain-containing protein [Flexibacter flexilis]SFC49723.1 Sporulation related domain-containing protein [Flexibacter flexilis DSM 6793]
MNTRIRVYFYVFLMGLFLIVGCKAGNNTVTNKKNTNTSVSSTWRPRFVPETAANASASSSASEIPATNSINLQINTLLDSIAYYNKFIDKAMGYRVIVYSGINREDANKVKEKIYKRFPDIDVYTTYKQPSFKVKVGDFFTRLEAQKMYNQLRNNFPNVLVIEDEIIIHR